VEKRRKNLSIKRKGAYAAKIKRATHILFYRKHQKPGVKGWEMHKTLGSEYPKVLDVLDDFLKPLDLQVKTVFEEEKAPEKPTPDDLDKARFYITLRGNLQPKEAKMIGWRIDDLAGLAITISYIISKKGQAARRDVEELLGEKLAGWKVSMNLDRYIRYGYLQQDENEQLYLDWRTRAEVDEKALIDLLLRSKEEEGASRKTEASEEDEEEANPEEEKQ
jgi:hypothetical protein